MGTSSVLNDTFFVSAPQLPRVIPLTDQREVIVHIGRTAPTHWTTITPVIAAPCTAHWYGYVPGLFNVTV